MVAHAARDHATWSASSTDRNWNCSGALALTKDLPETTSEAADWGTCAHEIAEQCLTTGKDAIEFVGETRKGKAHSFEVDEEMADTAQQFVDYVRGRLSEYATDTGDKATLIVEQRFSLADLDPPFDAGGTGDAVMLFPKWKSVEVADLKGGRGVVVEVKGNPQLRTYGLGTLMANPGPWRQIITTIVQPRAPHRDGRIRSETFSVADLVEWTSDLLAAMHRSAEALRFKEQSELYVGDGIVMSPAEWSSTFLSAGSHCKFCKAAKFCPALEQHALDAAGVWFDDLDQPRITNQPDALSPERAAQILDAADLISDWINAVRAHWHAQAEMGVEIPGYVLVPKQGREKWSEGKEAEAAKLAIAAGVPEEKVWNAPKIRTPKQVRAEAKKLKLDDAMARLEALSETPEAGTNLVRADKTTRSPAKPKVNQYFDVLD